MAETKSQAASSRSGESKEDHRASASQKRAALDEDLDRDKIKEMEAADKRAAENKKTAEGGAQSFTYKPQPGDPDSIFLFGQEFKKDEAVSVEDPDAIRKLKNNPAFMDPEDRAKKLEAHRMATDPGYAASVQRAKQAEKDLEDAKGDPDKDEVDTRVPEAPQASSIEQQRQRKLMEQVATAQRERPETPPPTEPPPEDARRR